MLQTKYITLDEFNEYFPDKNLISLFGTQEGAIAFLKRIEDRMESFIEANFDKNLETMYPKFTDYRKKHYKRALLEQCIYIIQNGDITVDSGYDPERGEIANIETLKKLAIAPNAKAELLLCGVWCRHLDISRNNYWQWWIK